MTAPLPPAALAAARRIATDLHGFERTESVEIIARALVAWGEAQFDNGLETGVSAVSQGIPWKQFLKKRGADRE